MRYFWIRRNSRGEPVPFVMELPNYRFPGMKSVGRLIWDKAKDFITRAFTVIFVATIIIWFLQTFDIHLNVVADSRDSMLALVGGWIAPIFEPLGFGDWRLFDGADHRLYSEGKRGQHHDGSDGRQYGPSEDIVHTVHSHRVPGVHTALYSLCSGCIGSQAGAGRKNGR